MSDLSRTPVRPTAKRSISSTIANLWRSHNTSSSSDKESGMNLQSGNSSTSGILNDRDVTLNMKTSLSDPKLTCIDPKQRLLILKYKQMIRQGKLDKVVKLLEQKDDITKSKVDKSYPLERKNVFTQKRKTNLIKDRLNIVKSNRNKTGSSFSFQPKDYQYDLSEYDSVCKDNTTAATVDKTAGSTDSTKKRNNAITTSIVKTNSNKNKLTTNQVDLLNGVFSKAHETPDKERDLSIVKIVPIVSDTIETINDDRSGDSTINIENPTVAFDFVKNSQKPLSNNDIKIAPVPIASTSLPLFSSNSIPTKMNSERIQEVDIPNKDDAEDKDDYENDTRNRKRRQPPTDIGSAKPMFSFGTKKATDSVVESVKPSFSFKPVSIQPAQPLSSETVEPKQPSTVIEKPSLSFFGAATVTKATPSATEKSQETPKISFSFGSNTSDNGQVKNTTETPSVSFGSLKPDENKPKFSFGMGPSTIINPLKTDSKPAVPLFGAVSSTSSSTKNAPGNIPATESKPAFSFGSGSTGSSLLGSKDTKPTTGFNFSTSAANPSAPASTNDLPKDSAPKFSFSLGSKPVVSDAGSSGLSFNLGAVNKPATSATPPPPPSSSSPFPQSSTPGTLKFNLGGFSKTPSAIAPAPVQNSFNLPSLGTKPASGFSFGAGAGASSGINSTRPNTSMAPNNFSFGAAPQQPVIPQFKPSTSINMNFGTSSGSTGLPPSAIFGAGGGANANPLFQLGSVPPSHSPSPAAVFGASSATPPSMNMGFGNSNTGMNMGMNQGMNQGMGQGMNPSGFMNNNNNSNGMFNANGMNSQTGTPQLTNLPPGRRIMRPRRRN